MYCIMMVHDGVSLYGEVKVHALKDRVEAFARRTGEKDDFRKPLVKQSLA